MTDAVRYRLDGCDAGMTPAHDGVWVRFCDYAATRAALAEAQAEIARLTEGPTESDRYRSCIPQGYQTTLLGKHEARQPTVIRSVMDEVAGTWAADLIAWLTWWNCLDAQRFESVRKDDLARAEAAEAALVTARDEGLAEAWNSHVDRDFFDLIVDGMTEADRAMKRFPQPNYVITKVAEEAGEVVKAAIHCAEGRETAENVRGEMRQLVAMLYRLWVEGDQVHGLAAIRALIGEGRDDGF